MKDNQPSMQELLKAANRIDSNIESEELARERAELLAKHGLTEKQLQPTPALVREAEKPVEVVQPASQADALAALFPPSSADDDEPTLEKVNNHGTDENGQPEGQSGGDDQSERSDSEEGSSDSADDQGEGGEALNDSAEGPATPWEIPLVNEAPKAPRKGK